MWPMLQSSFAAALTDLHELAPPGVRSWTGTSRRRFAVYRNNVVTGLVDALAARFPVAQRIVGEAFFAAMAQVFVARCPPASPALLEYGGAFAQFVQGFEPAFELPYLPDVIRLEDARVRAYHARDAEPLSRDDLASIPLDRLAALAFDMHPSTALVRSPYPIVTIWAMNVGELELAPIEDWSGEDALVVRPELSVHVHRLPAGGAAFVERLLAGDTLGVAAQTAMLESAEFDLVATLTTILSAGLLTSIGNSRGDE